MRILAIETIDFSGTIAALDGGNILCKCPLDASLRSAQSLAPGLAEMLRQVGWRPAEVQLVAVATGPGSFTGLRVGVTTAKMFAYAVGAEVIGIHTLAAIAAQAPPTDRRLWTVLNAERGQVFAARFMPRGNESGIFDDDPETLLLHEDEWLARLQPGDYVSGPILEKLQPRLPPGINVVDAAQWRPRAGTVGRIAWEKYQAGTREQLASLLPRYYRKSAAEEKRLAETRP